MKQKQQKEQKGQPTCLRSFSIEISSNISPYSCRRCEGCRKPVHVARPRLEHWFYHDSNLRSSCHTASEVIRDTLLRRQEVFQPFLDLIGMRRRMEYIYTENVWTWIFELWYMSSHCMYFARWVRWVTWKLLSLGSIFISSLVVTVGCSLRPNSFAATTFTFTRHAHTEEATTPFWNYLACTCPHFIWFLSSAHRLPNHRYSRCTTQLHYFHWHTASVKIRFNVQMSDGRLISIKRSVCGSIDRGRAVIKKTTGIVPSRQLLTWRGVKPSTLHYIRSKHCRQSRPRNIYR